MNPHITRLVQEVSERILNLGLYAIRIGKEVVTHGHTHITVSDDVIILETHGGPSLDGKALIFLDVTRGYEVGKRSVEGGAELFLSGKGGLEEDGWHIVRIESVDVVRGSLGIVFVISVGRGDGDNALAPGVLGGFNLFPGD